MKNEIYPPHSSSIGNLNANAMALICYLASTVLGWIPLVRYVAWLAPLALFLMEKQSRFVKFHAMQSFLLHIVSAVLSFLVSVVLGGILGIGSTRAVPLDLRKKGESIPGKVIAILKMDKDNLPTVIVGGDSFIKTGDSVYAMGYPALSA